MQSCSKRMSPWATALCFFSLGAVSNANDWPVTLSRLPESPNAIARIDLAALKSLGEGGHAEKAKFAKLASDLAETWSTNVSGIVLAAHIDLNSLEPTWEVAEMRVDRPVALADLATYEGGYSEQVAGRTMVWSPRNLYLTVEGKSIRLLRPANRQLLARWFSRIDANRTEGLGSFLSQIVRVPTAEVPIVMALDLEASVSPAVLKDKLTAFGPLAKDPTRLAEVSKVILGIRGLTFAVQAADNTFRGRVIVDFDSSVQALAGIEKELLVRSFESRGLSFDELESWTPASRENRVTLTGDLSARSLYQILSMLRSPHELGTLAGTADIHASSRSVTNEQLSGEASRKYYRSVKKTIEDVRNFKAKTLGQRATYVDRMARQINELPILNVDDLLLAFGKEVASSLQNAALAIRKGNIQTGVDRASFDRSQYYNEFNVAWNDPNRVIAGKEAENRQKSYNTFFESMTDIDARSMELRQQMTQKYGVEF